MRQVLEIFLKNSLTEAPVMDKSNAPSTGDRAWVFVAQDHEKTPVMDKSCRTWQTLNKYLENENYIYWAPNTFYRRDYRRKADLRWLNAIFLDIDDPALIIDDVIERCQLAGLPQPTLINKTPRGFHVYWAITPVRATLKAIKLYEIITGLIARTVDSDTNAVGAERYVRLPRNIQYFTGQEYDLDVFKEWREINCMDELAATGATVTVLPKGILSHPAFKRLLAGVEEGIRDNTCFTIALALRAEGYTNEQAFVILTEWNKKNAPPLALNLIRTKIRSAYSGRYHGPSAKWVTELSGIPFAYYSFTPAKPREERKYLHLNEIEEMILNYLCGQKEQVAMSQAALAQTIVAPLRSVKKALYALQKSGKLLTHVEGKGRAARTSFTLLNAPVELKTYREKSKTREQQPNQQVSFLWKGHQNIMVQNSIHPVGVVLVGGTLGFPRGSP